MRASTSLPSLTLFLGLLSASACSHPQLAGRGSEVVLLRPEATPACELLGHVTGKSLGSVFFGDSLLASAENGLRNRAGDLGATHVVARRWDPSAHAYFIEGDAYRCAQASPQVPNAPAAPAAPATQQTPAPDSQAPASQAPSEQTAPPVPSDVPQAPADATP